MSETFCGKSCGACTWKAQLDCPGCKIGPGNSFSGDCELAQCCQNKRHESCGTCTSRASCTILSGREHIPSFRLRQRNALVSQAAQLAETAPFLQKWIGLLFWLVLPQLAANLMTNETVAARFPFLTLPGQILSFLCLLAYSLILLKLSSRSSFYRTAGICSLFSAAAGVVTALLSSAEFLGNAPAILLLLVSAIISLTGEYNEYNGHREILEGVDAVLQKKWADLWKWFLISSVALLGSLMVILILPLLGIFTLLAGCVILVVVCLLKLVYLYQTARAFGRISQTDL